MIEFLPLSLSDIEVAIGEKKTLKLVEAIGGQRIWIPLKPPIDWALFNILGHEAGSKLAALCGGCQIEIPICRKLKVEERNQRIRADRANLSISQLVDKYQLTRKYLLRVCKTPS